MKLSRFAFTIFYCTAFALPDIVSAADYAYLTYFTDAECTKFSGIKGFVSGEEFQIRKALGDKLTCQEAMACFLRPDSEACADLNAGTDYADLLMEVQGADVYRCDTSNEESGQEECAAVQSSDCISSSTYNCYFRWASLDTLKDNTNAIIPPSSGEGLENYAYVAYYTDDACNDFASLRGASSENPYEQMRLESDAISCIDKQACFLAPEGSTCQNLIQKSDQETFTVTLETDGTTVYECDLSNEATGEPICDIIDSEDCIPSSSMYGCNFHMMTAIELAQDPEKIINPSGSRW